MKPTLIDRCGAIMFFGLAMAAVANTTLRHSRTDIAGGYRELVILLLLVCRGKIRIVVSPVVMCASSPARGVEIAAIWLSSDHFTGTSAFPSVCKQPKWRSLGFWRNPGRIRWLKEGIIGESIIYKRANGGCYEDELSILYPSA